MTLPRSRDEEGLNHLEIGVLRRKVLVELGFQLKDYPKWKEKWNNFCGSAVDRGVECRVTFRLYLLKARTAGIKRPSGIGQTSGKFQMGRKGDIGGYTKANCRFITVEQNQEERKINGGAAVATEKAAKLRRGQTKETHEHLARMAEQLRGRTSDTHEYLVKAGVKRGRAFTVRSPSGKRYSGQSLNAFCKQHGLVQGSMSLLCRGKIDEYKGWTGGYTEELKSWYKTKEDKCTKTKKSSKKGDRYVITEFDESGTTWSIVDTETHLVYALMLTKLSNFIFQIDLVELFTRMCSPRFLSYSQEIMSARIEVSEPRSAYEFARFILGELRDGEDVANPIELAVRIGASLHGQPIAWPMQKDMQ